jgi:hypothetical protein
MVELASVVVLLAGTGQDVDDVELAVDAEELVVVVKVVVVASAESVVAVEGDDTTGSGVTGEACAARLRSPYWMLQRTASLLALMVGSQVVKRGQQASAVPSSRLVQGTELGSSQFEGWSTWQISAASLLGQGRQVSLMLRGR